MIISNEQMEHFKLNAEANYKQRLIIKKSEQYNSSNKINKETFRNRIFINYETARYYGFNLKTEIEKFIDFTFLYEALNNKAPLQDNIHYELRVAGRASDLKFEMISSILKNKKG